MDHFYCYKVLLYPFPQVKLARWVLSLCDRQVSNWLTASPWFTRLAELKLAPGLLSPSLLLSFQERISEGSSSLTELLLLFREVSFSNFCQWFFQAIGKEILSYPWSFGRYLWNAYLYVFNTVLQNTGEYKIQNYFGWTGEILSRRIKKNDVAKSEKSGPDTEGSRVSGEGEVHVGEGRQGRSHFILFIFKN